MLRNRDAYIVGDATVAELQPEVALVIEGGFDHAKSEDLALVLAWHGVSQASSLPLRCCIGIISSIVEIHHGPNGGFQA